MSYFKAIEIAKEYTPLYSWKEIEAVAEWQNYGGYNYKNLDLYRLQQKLPNKIKQYSGRRLVRFIMLSPDSYSKLIKGIPFKHSKLESWTTSLKLAKSIFMDMGMSDEADYSYKLVFIEYKPSPNEIFINLVELWKNKEWLKSIKHYEDQRKFFSEGLDFEGLQKEIILRRTGTFDKSNILEAYNYEGKKIFSRK